MYVNQLAGVAKRFAIGDAKSLPERLQKAFAYFTTVLGVEQAKVLAYLERPSMQDCNLEDLGELQDLKTMLKEGDISIETAFPDPAKAGATPDLGQQKPDLGQTQPPQGVQGTTQPPQPPGPPTQAQTQAPPQKQPTARKRAEAPAPARTPARAADAASSQPAPA